MKRLLSLLIGLSLLFSLTGCASNASSVQSGAEEPGKLQAVVTVWPAYDWLTNLLGEQAGNWELTLLCDSGVDLHSYQPTAEDLLKISGCDLLVYVGGASDEWVADALKNAVNQDMVSLSLLEALGDMALEEETVEGMQPEEDEEEEELDEHVWLSLRNAQALCSFLVGALKTIDSAHGDEYAGNYGDYCQKLSELDGRYQTTLAGADYDTLLFADRFPFRYLCHDYGLNYYAAFPGCSAETEASFETVAFLSNKLAELGLPAVCVTERPAESGALADTIIKTAGVDAATVAIDSMQYYTGNYEATGGYLGAMEYNLPMLMIALCDTPPDGFECIYYTSP